MGPNSCIPVTKGLLALVVSSDTILSMAVKKDSNLLANTEVLRKIYRSWAEVLSNLVNPCMHQLMNSSSSIEPSLLASSDIIIAWLSSWLKWNLESMFPRSWIICNMTLNSDTSRVELLSASNSRKISLKRCRTMLSVTTILRWSMVSNVNLMKVGSMGPSVLATPSSVGIRPPGINVFGRDVWHNHMFSRCHSSRCVWAKGSWLLFFFLDMPFSCNILLSTMVPRPKSSRNLADLPMVAVTWEALKNRVARCAMTSSTSGLMSK